MTTMHPALAAAEIHAFLEVAARSRPRSGRSIPMRKRHFVGVLILLLTVACSRGGVLLGDDGIERIQGTAAHYYALRDGHVFFVVWHDQQRGAADAGSWWRSAQGGTADAIAIDGAFQTDDGDSVTWTLRSADGEAGAVTIDRRDFDLAQGGLFVVATGMESPRITQIDVRLGQIDAIGRTLADLAQHQPAVRALVGDDDAPHPPLNK